jgi:hypothetical protein
MMLGVVSVLVLAFHPMHAVVLAKPLQFGTPIRLASRSVVLVNAGFVYVFVPSAELPPHDSAS